MLAKQLNQEDLVQIIDYLELHNFNLVDERCYGAATIKRKDGNLVIVADSGKTGEPIDTDKIVHYLLTFRKEGTDHGISIAVNRRNKSQFSISLCAFITDSLVNSKEIKANSDLQETLTIDFEALDFTVFKNTIEGMRNIKNLSISQEDIIEIKGIALFGMDVNKSILDSIEIEGVTNYLEFYESFDESVLSTSLHIYKKAVTGIVNATSIVLNRKVHNLQREKMLKAVTVTLASAAFPKGDPRVKALQIKNLDKLSNALTLISNE